MLNPGNPDGWDLINYVLSVFYNWGRIFKEKESFFIYKTLFVKLCVAFFHPTARGRASRGCPRSPASASTRPFKAVFTVGGTCAYMCDSVTSFLT